MAKGHSRELTDPFQSGSKSGVPGFLRKKRFILLLLTIIGVIWVYTTRAPAVRTKEHELEDLLQFFVAAPEVSLPVDLDASAELSRKSLVAAAAGRSGTVPPVVVFSKTYCPYSKRAKNLLSSLNLEPAPYVIEVDLRSDSDTVKALLMRLTGHGTFPNILVRRKSIGGSDDLVRLHENGELVPLLATAGVSAGVA
ncbi:Monothiol glutaredoxin-S6 OS=Oryza sativa subsp, japonica GN=GRXS6 PE=2 SV=1 [Rhizoctonia solani AG-1 IB]|uniref:Monothiol glutaredoxin-S6 n=1 Tax=Thanatephorus cucumeris (strain AG1-IB / isolate 7/3/14) TaxID=1108050 RepID=A0A0B7FWX0_THACB|nr:Monothiol glutaredoxin-S6 OS=Oryza sativa subsp, japonica GN=GRXS6 PE=2 SV=1 [Rhizoctonia solani AG-1 IB]